MKKILAFILCFVLAFSYGTTVFAADFADTVDHKNKEAIDTLNTIGLIEGYGNNIFGPDDFITRAQLCTMLVRAIYSNDLHYNTVNRFTDVPLSHWARIYIDTAYRNAIMVGNGDGTFAPDKNVTYTEVARTILNALGYGTLGWPDEVNIVALELGIYKNVFTSDYTNACTRAQAAQMIYNAFDLQLVKDRVGMQLPTDKFFLADLLGYTKVTVTENGVQYVAYKNIATGNTVRTNIVLTTEQTIYPNALGTAYKFVDTYRAETYTIDWSTVTLFVNNVQVVNGTQNYFKNSDMAVGIFDLNGALVSIRVVNSGISYVAATGFSNGVIPVEVLQEVRLDQEYNPLTSTITYYDESGLYEISNTIVAGYVTNMTRGFIWINDVPYAVKDTFNYVPYMNKFVVLYYNVHNIMVDIMYIENPYYYDMWNMTVHTWECASYHNRVTDSNWANGVEAVKLHPLTTFWLNKTGNNLLIFNSCDQCHAKDVTNPNINFIFVEIPEEPETPATVYVTVDGWNYYHTEDCEFIKNTTKELIYIDDVENCGKLRHECVND